MPGRFILITSVAQIAETAGVAAIEAQPERRNVAPGQQVVTLGTDGLSLMRWGIIPVGRVNARGRPIMETLINARSETVFDKSAYEGTTRAVVPADGWYEWTGEKRRKTAWRITARDGGLLWFAAICDVWHGPGGVTVPQVATVTCPPNADVAPIHHRMGVLLEAADLGLWLRGSEAAVTPLMRPWPVGRLAIEEAGDVDWTQA